MFPLPLCPSLTCTTSITHCIAQWLYGVVKTDWCSHYLFATLWLMFPLPLCHLLTCTTCIICNYQHYMLHCTQWKLTEFSWLSAVSLPSLTLTTSIQYTAWCIGVRWLHIEMVVNSVFLLWLACSEQLHKRVLILKIGWDSVCVCVCVCVCACVRVCVCECMCIRLIGLFRHLGLTSKCTHTKARHILTYPSTLLYVWLFKLENINNVKDCRTVVH